MIKKLTFLFFLLWVGSQVAFSRDNPFFAPKREQGTAQNQKPASPGNHYPGFVQGALNGINGLQQKLNRELSVLTRAIKQGENRHLFFWLFALALIYGIIHALGPGHGKVIMISYALSNPLKAAQGLWLGVFIAVIHTFSAIILVSLLYFILHGSYAAYSREPKQIISLVSYALIAVMGGGMFLKTLFFDILKLKKKKTPAEGGKIPEQGNRRSLILPALIIGLVPCEGAVLILVFSISINAFGLGILLALAMSCGIALTIAVLGVLAIYSKKGALRLSRNGAGLMRWGALAFQLVGALVILSFGLLLFLSTI